MESRYLDMYRWQMLHVMNSGEQVFYSKFIDEYTKLFNIINRRKIESCYLLEDIEFRVGEVLKVEEDILVFLEMLMRRIDKCFLLLKELFNFDDLKVILFIGDGSIDGHGLIIDNSAYVIFDIYTLYQMRDVYIMDVYILHELIYPLHYSLSKEYYLDEDGLEELYFKKIYLVGLATYLSWQGSFASLEESYWFGYFNRDKVEKWEYNCQNERANIGLRIVKSINSNNFDINLYHELFNLRSVDDYRNSRMAYFYGFHIVKILARDRSLEDLLLLKFKIAREHIIDYFNL